MSHFQLSCNLCFDNVYNIFELCYFEELCKSIPNSSDHTRAYIDFGVIPSGASCWTVESELAIIEK